MSAPCPVCHAAPGAYHRHRCDWEDCPYCGCQLILCGHDVPLDDRMRWSGQRTAEEMAMRMGWYTRLLPGRGWVPCQKGDLGAWLDLNRVYAECPWDREKQRFSFNG